MDFITDCFIIRERKNRMHLYQTNFTKHDRLLAMNKKVLIFLCFALMLFVSACSPSDNLIGTWEIPNLEGIEFNHDFPVIDGIHWDTYKSCLGEITFYQDGTFSARRVIIDRDPQTNDYSYKHLGDENYNGNYSIVHDGSALTLSIDQYSDTYEFKLSGNNLTIKGQDGHSFHFKRKV